MIVRFKSAVRRGIWIRVGVGGADLGALRVDLGSWNVPGGDEVVDDRPSAAGALRSLGVSRLSGRLVRENGARWLTWKANSWRSALVVRLVKSLRDPGRPLPVGFERDWAAGGPGDPEGRYAASYAATPKTSPVSNETR